MHLLYNIHNLIFTVLPNNPIQHKESNQENNSSPDKFYPIIIGFKEIIEMVQIPINNLKNKYNEFKN